MVRARNSIGMWRSIPQVPTALTLNVGANKSMLDLRDLNLTDLKLETGASDTHVTLPARGRYRADFDLGAASLNITIPDGLSARIRASVGVADFKVDESRFPRNAAIINPPILTLPSIQWTSPSTRARLRSR